MGAQTSYYTDKSVREDLLDIITNLTPTETQIISGLQTTTAKSVRHEWLQDTLSAVKFNSYVEGVDGSYAVTDPTRLINYCQIVRQGFSVTDTQDAVDHAGFADRYSYEAAKAMKVWKNDACYSILLNSLNCGSASVGRTMQGIYQWVALTNATNQSGTSLSESNLLDYLARCWNQGTEIDEVYVGATLKKRIDGFTAGATKTVPIADKRLINSVDVYESSFAPLVKVFLHRYVNNDALISGVANANNIMGIDSSMYAISYLRKPFMRDLAKTGDSNQGEIVGELTLEDRSNGLGGFIGQLHF
jgi:hypothetical protein